MNSADLFSLLVAQTWQLALVAIAALVVHRCCARDRPHLAHVLWALVILKCVTPPIWSSPVSPFSWLSRSIAVADQGPTKNASQLPPASPPRLPPVKVTLEPGWEPGSNPIAKDSPSVEAAGLKTPINSRGPGSLLSILCATWLAAAAVGLCFTALRLMRFLRIVLRTRLTEYQHLQKHLDKLRQRLGVRRQVRLQIVKANIGPAVVGLVRPTILLPEIVVAEKTASQLEPLLAHELVHIRRGDLWWAMLQTMANCLWWFHPLIWMASKMLTREAERSCDEETVMSLGYQPATYARALVDVLERKHELRIAPALPGVKPVEVTANRLERIMRLRHGSYSKSPWWVAIVMVLGGMAVLPGAGIGWAQDAKGSQPLKGPDGNLAPEIGKIYPHPLPPVPFLSSNTATSAVAESVSDFATESFNISAARKRLIKDGNPEAQVDQILLSNLPQRTADDDGKTTPHGLNVQMSVSHGIITLGDDEPAMKIAGNKLYVLDTSSRRRAVEERLNSISKFGVSLVKIEMTLLAAPAELVGKLRTAGANGSTTFSRTPVSAIAGEANFIATRDVPNPSYAPSPIALTAADVRGTLNVASSGFVTEINPTVTKFDPRPFLLDEKQQAVLKNVVLKDKRVNVLSRPHVVVINGQSAKVQIGREVPFVMGMEPVSGEDDQETKTIKPQIGFVMEGTSVDVRPELLNERAVRVELQVNLDKIVGVNDVSLKEFEAAIRNQLNVQQPQVHSRQLKTNVTLPLQETLVISGLEMEGEGTELAVMLNCQVVNPIADEVGHKLPGSAQENVELPRLPEAKGSGGDEYRPLEAALAAFDRQFKLDGKPDYELSNKQVQVVGERLRLEFLGPEGVPFQVTANQCELQFDRASQKFQGLFKGKARLQYGDFRITADRIELTNSVANLSGDVNAASDEFEFHLDSAKLSIEKATVEFHGSSFRIPTDKSKEE